MGEDLDDIEYAIREQERDDYLNYLDYKEHRKKENIQRALIKKQKKAERRKYLKSLKKFLSR